MKGIFSFLAQAVTHTVIMGFFSPFFFLHHTELEKFSLRRTKLRPKTGETKSAKYEVLFSVEGRGAVLQGDFHLLGESGGFGSITQRITSRLV